MLNGNLIVENFGWSNPEEVEFPGVDPQTGIPTGAVIKRRVFRVQSVDGGVIIEFRIAPEDWDRFIQSLSGRHVQFANAQELAQLKRSVFPGGNGGS